MSLEETVDSDAHVWQEKWIGEMLQARFEVIADRGRFAKAAIDEALCEQRRNFQILRQTASEQWLQWQQ